MQNILLATLTTENPLGVIWSVQPGRRSCFWPVTSDDSGLGECETRMRHRRWGAMGIKGKKFPWPAHAPLSWSLSLWSAVLIPHREDLEREKGHAARYLRGKAQLNLHTFCCSCKEDKTSLFRFYYYYWKQQTLGTRGVQGCGGELQAQEEEKNKKRKSKFNCINTTEIRGSSSTSRENSPAAQDQLTQPPAEHTHGHRALGAPSFTRLKSALRKGSFHSTQLSGSHRFCLCVIPGILNTHSPSHQQEVKPLGRDASLVTGWTAWVLGHTGWGLHILRTRQLWAPPSVFLV